MSRHPRNLRDQGERHRRNRSIRLFNAEWREIQEAAEEFRSEEHSWRSKGMEPGEFVRELVLHVVHIVKNRPKPPAPKGEPHYRELLDLGEFLSKLARAQAPPEPGDTGSRNARGPGAHRTKGGGHG
jgi:hypothetical protein